MAACLAAAAASAAAAAAAPAAAVDSASIAAADFWRFDGGVSPLSIMVPWPMRLEGLLLEGHRAWSLGVD